MRPHPSSPALGPHEGVAPVVWLAVPLVREGPLAGRRADPPRPHSVVEPRPVDVELHDVDDALLEPPRLLPVEPRHRVEVGRPVLDLQRRRLGVVGPEGRVDDLRVERPHGREAVLPHHPDDLEQPLDALGARQALFLRQQQVGLPVGRHPVPHHGPEGPDADVAPPRADGPLHDGVVGHHQRAHPPPRLACSHLLDRLERLERALKVAPAHQDAQPERLDHRVLRPPRLGHLVKHGHRLVHHPCVDEGLGEAREGVLVGLDAPLLHVGHELLRLEELAGGPVARHQRAVDPDVGHDASVVHHRHRPLRGLDLFGADAGADEVRVGEEVGLDLVVILHGVEYVEGLLPPELLGEASEDEVVAEPVGWDLHLSHILNQVFRPGHLPSSHARLDERRVRDPVGPAPRLAHLHEHLEGLVGLLLPRVAIDHDVERHLGRLDRDPHALLRLGGEELLEALPELPLEGGKEPLRT
mmetsp:Transcript_49907/g.124536  ORF Transcript_49907/g.124536 Transcript_49907/m.124536 type:complete len:470 (+) Transcript_49907:55-1464(+)